MKITYYGHSCIEITTGNLKILIDPFISANPLAKKVDISKIKPNYILLTHAHEDHMLDAEVIAKQSDATIIANPEIVKYYSNLGLKTHAMNIGGKFKFNPGEFKMVSAIHSSSFPDGTYGGLACGFLFNFKEHIVYVAGDTALTTDIKTYPFVYGRIDVAILPIGGNFTMDVSDAIVAGKFLKVKTILGYHYDTFPLIKLDHQYAKKRFLEEEKELILLPIEGVLNIH